MSRASRGSGAIFEADKPLWKLPPTKRHALRQDHLRALVDSNFVLAKANHVVTTERGLVATALGYAVRQEAPLRRFLDDGRLRLENNGAERALRPIASGRKAWLFVGSDDHAQAAANLFSLIASCQLHGLDPETYFTDIFRVMPYWPRDRYLELAPKHWARTRARLDPAGLPRAAPRPHLRAPAASAGRANFAALTPMSMPAKMRAPQVTVDDGVRAAGTVER